MERNGSRGEVTRVNRYCASDSKCTPKSGMLHHTTMYCVRYLKVCHVDDFVKVEVMNYYGYFVPIYRTHTVVIIKVKRCGNYNKDVSEMKQGAEVQLEG